MAASTNPARGMRDFLPIDVRKREYVIRVIKEVYESYGFEPLETPAVENLETLTGKYGEEGNQLIFKILKRGEKLEQELEAGNIKSENDLSDLALRYDLTVPLARVVANHKNELPKFFKRYQIQPVWRADRPARGRYREFYQCDVDAIGSKSMIVEAELCAAASEVLQRLGFEDFVIRVNHRKILTGILKASGITEEKHNDALIALDKLDKIGREGVLEELNVRGVPENSGEQLIIFIEKTEKTFTEYDAVVRNLYYSNEQKNRTASEDLNKAFSDLDKAFGMFNFHYIKGLKEFIENSKKESLEEFEEINFVEEQGITDLENIIRFAEVIGLSKIRLDPSLARGLSYYTGAIFEINVPDLAGSLGGGGRYDGLIGIFGKEEIPACGFSLGLERILVVMNERGMFPPELETNSADVLVTVWSEETAGESLKLAGELRAKGLRVLVYPEADKLGKQFKYASQVNIPFVCVVGENELAENKVALKNMLTGAQETVSREAIAGKIKG